MMTAANVIETTPNEVYGVNITDGIETSPNDVYRIAVTEDIDTTSNEVYGLRILTARPQEREHEAKTTSAAAVYEDVGDIRH